MEYFILGYIHECCSAADDVDDDASVRVHAETERNQHDGKVLFCFVTRGEKRE